MLSLSIRSIITMKWIYYFNKITTINTQTQHFVMESNLDLNNYNIDNVG